MPNDCTGRVPAGRQVDRQTDRPWKDWTASLQACDSHWYNPSFVLLSEHMIYWCCRDAKRILLDVTKNPPVKNVRTLAIKCLQFPWDNNFLTHFLHPPGYRTFFKRVGEFAVGDWKLSGSTKNPPENNKVGCGGGDCVLGTSDAVWRYEQRGV